MGYVVLLAKRAKHTLPKPGCMGCQHIEKPLIEVFSASHDNLRMYCRGTSVSRSNHDPRLQRSNVRAPPSVVISETRPRTEPKVEYHRNARSVFRPQHSSRDNPLAREDSTLLFVLVLPRHARAIQTPGRTLKQPASARPDTVSQTVFRSKHLGTCLTVAIKDHGIQKKTRGQ